MSESRARVRHEWSETDGVVFIDFGGYSKKGADFCLGYELDIFYIILNIYICKIGVGLTCLDWNGYATLDRQTRPESSVMTGFLKLHPYVLKTFVEGDSEGTIAFERTYL